MWLDRRCRSLQTIMATEKLKVVSAWNYAFCDRDHDFFTIWYPRDSSFCRYQAHPEIRRGSLRAKVLNEGEVGTNGRFSTFKSQYLRNSATYDKGYYWSLITNRIHAFDWYKNQRRWLTLKWTWTTITHSLALCPVHTADADATKLSSCVVSAVWTHPSALVTQFTISCADYWQVTT